MKFRNLHHWKITTESIGLLYFAQRMDELLFDFTLDSFKPPALTPVTLCNEALEFIDSIEGGAVDEAGLSPILDELSHTISRDNISKRMLDVSLDQYVKNNKSTPLGFKKIRLEVLSRTLDSQLYFSRVLDFLHEAIEQNHKKDINHAARLLVSTLINRGLSKTFLYRKSYEYFFSGKIGPEQITSHSDLGPFLEIITPVLHDFDVFFIISKEIQTVENSIEAFGIEIIEELPQELQKFADKQEFSASQGEVLVQIKDVRCFDCHSAREIAERRIDTLRDLFTLYYHRSELTWKNRTLISQCCVDFPVLVRRPKSPMQKAFDSTPEFASKRLNYLLKNLSLHFDKGQSFMKFNRIVDLHGIAVTNEVPENQLLNLWISLETLVPSKTGGQSKLKNMLSSLDPFIRGVYLARLVERTYKDLSFWNSYATRKILRQVEGAKGRKGVIKLMALIVIQSEKNEELRNELYVQLKDFHLLRNRVFQLWESFSSPEKIRETIDNHSQMVEWQIRRLYRTRNMLVHSGKKPKYLDSIIENGHDYLDMVLDVVVALSCGPNSIRSLEQAFELQQIKLLSVERMLKESNQIDWGNISAFYHPEWLLSNAG